MKTLPPNTTLGAPYRSGPITIHARTVGRKVEYRLHASRPWSEWSEWMNVADWEAASATWIPLETPAAEPEPEPEPKLELKVLKRRQQ